MNTTRPDVRRFTPDHVYELPALIEATDGGAYIRVGDIELAIVPPDEDDADRTFNYAVRAHAAIAELLAQAPAALAQLDALIAELGMPCTTCRGTKGYHEVEVHGMRWVECYECRGVGRVPVRKAAA